MKYIKLSFEYMFKNFWHVLVLSLVPGILLGALTDPTSMFGYIVNISKDTAMSFGDIFSATSELTWWSFLIAIVVFPIVCTFISALCGIESKHMRLGIKGFGNFFKRVNNNLLYVMLTGLTLLFSLEIMGLIFASFAFLWNKVFARVTLILTMNILTAVIMMLLLLIVISICIIWLPTMTITGLNPKKALGQTIINVRGKKMFKLFIAVCLPLIPIYLIACLLSYYQIKLRIIYNVITYIFMVMYYVTLMYTSYCDICDIDREDKKDKFNSLSMPDKVDNHDGNNDGNNDDNNMTSEDKEN